jgi:hypothetical protein
MDPNFGMGIEFLSRTAEHRHRLEQLIHRKTLTPDAVAEVLVEPEGLEWDDGAAASPGAPTHSPADPVEPDPLLELFRNGAVISREQFVLDLEKHQWATSPENASELNMAEPTFHQRREPRIAVSQPVHIWGQNLQESFPEMTSMIDVSHRGARVGGVALHLKAGEVVHLVSDGVDARFRVIWVGEPGTPREGQIGLQGLKTDD